MGGWSLMFEEWGYPESFAYLVGTLEVAAVLGLYIKRTRMWAGWFIILIMAGAVYTHIRSEEYLRILHNLVLMAMSYAMIWLSRRREKDQ